MMGGGNTFRLLDTLAGLGVVEGLSARVRAGETRYLGASAGTNVACPTIRTTNDMPICQPASFDALGLIPFQINLHYVDPDPTSTFMGETREERIEEFLEENHCPVLALYEGSWLRVSKGRATVTGPLPAVPAVRGRGLRRRLRHLPPARPDAPLRPGPAALRAHHGLNAGPSGSGVRARTRVRSGAQRSAWTSPLLRPDRARAPGRLL